MTPANIPKTPNLRQTSEKIKQEGRTGPSGDNHGDHNCRRFVGMAVGGQPGRRWSDTT